VLRLGLRSSRAWITFSWAQIKSRRWLISAGDVSEEVMAGNNASAYLSPIPNPLHTAKPCKPCKPCEKSRSCTVCTVSGYFAIKKRGSNEKAARFPLRLCSKFFNHHGTPLGYQFAAFSDWAAPISDN
jgi:hypothetical protein